MMPSANSAIFLLLTAALAAPATAQVPGASDYFRLFEHSNLNGGFSTRYLTGAVRNVPVDLHATNWGDKASSLLWNYGPNIALHFHHDSDGGGDVYLVLPSAPNPGNNLNVGPVHNDRFSSFSWQYEVPSAGIVTLHDWTGTQGPIRRLALSSFTEGSLHQLLGYNDKAESLSWGLLPTNVVLTFYENSNGSARQYTIRHNDARQGGVTLPSSIRNKITAWRWQTVDPAAGYVEIFTDSNFTGDGMVRYLSELQLGLEELPSHYKNTCSSLRWTLPPNRTIICYEDSTPNGKRLALVANGQHVDLDTALSGIYDDKLESLEFIGAQVTSTFADRNVPFDRTCHLSSHNAVASSAMGFAHYYQTLDIRGQLDSGVRMLQVDTLMHTDNVLYCVHGTYSETVFARLGAAPDKLSAVLQDINGWLAANPTEFVVLSFEHQGTSALGSYLLSPNCPLAGKLHRQGDGTWPSINEMVQSGKRAIVLQYREGEHPGIPWAWDYTVENGYSSFGSTSARSESAAINFRNRALFTMNHIDSLQVPATWFGATPNSFVNLTSLAAQFAQIPNFVNIDHVAANGQALDAVRHINMQKWGGLDVGGTKATWAKFGDGCGTASISPHTLPLLGTTVPFVVSSLSFMVVGLSDQMFGSVPLPFPMSALFPASPCYLRASPDITSFSASTIWVLDLPNSSALNGLEIFVQGAQLLDVSVPTSALWRARIGTR